MNNLQPCPFCGSEEIEIKEISFRFSLFADWMIFCDNCECSFLSSNSGLPCSRKELIERWNKAKR